MIISYWITEVAKKTTLVFFLLFVSLSNASSQEYLKVEGFLNRTFSKVDSGTFADLIPFCKNGNWGYLNRNTKLVVVQPVFAHLSFFHPDMSGTYNDVDFSINSATGKVVVDREVSVPTYRLESANTREEIEVKVIPAREGFKGFKLNDKGKLIAYSALYEYNKQRIPAWNVQPFKFKGGYFAIVNNLQGNCGIIDSVGNTMEGFDFNYKKILLNFHTIENDKVWFYVSTKNDVWSLINTDGEIKLKDEIFTYPLTSQRMFGITPLYNQKIYSVFDGREMKWIIKPQSVVKIDKLFFSSEKILDESNPSDRDLNKIYYKVTTKNLTYYQSLNGEKFIPKYNLKTKKK